MRKPLLLTIATDQGIGLGDIVIDMDKIVAMYEARYDNDQENAHRTYTRLLPVAGQHLQVIQGMRQIWETMIEDSEEAHGSE